MNPINSESSHQEQVQPTSSITLDQVAKALSEWRANKSSQGTSIPDAIWLDIFELAKSHPPSGLRSIFQLSTTQYKNKFEKLCKPVPDPLVPAEETAAPSATTAAASQGKEVTLYEVTTKPLYEPDVLPKPADCMVVETHKPDGSVMKFHITLSQLRHTLKEFLAD